jgi:diguanylate cyclase (GGDEF)-like protein/PAS domain S-box-containing protein
MANDAPADIHDYLRLLERAPEMFRRAWDAIAIYDLDGRIMLGNAAARALVGSDLAAELQGRHFTSHLTLEEATKTAHDFARCATLGETVEGQSVLLDGSGQAIPVRLRLVPARVDGRIVGVVGFARDDRRRRDVEEQFMRSEQQFRSLFENHPDALALHDLEGRFLRVNAACERLSGYSVEELIAQTPAMLVASGRYDTDAVRASIERGETTEFDFQIKTKSGRIREVNGRRVPLHAEGTERAWCGIIRDVTEERRTARSSARQATRIAELYRIAATAGVAVGEKVATVLEAGLAELGAEWAFVGRLAAGEVEIVHATGKMPLGARLHVDRARLQRALQAGDVFVIDDPAAHPRSFSGASFSVEGLPYGALAFVRDGEPMRVSAADRDYIRALAVLIGSAIQQGERDQRLDTLAFRDVLTGLPNRALLTDRLDQTLLAARRHRRSFAAHYIDIDYFKAINDSYGHDVGDAALVAVSGWLRSALRDSDTIGRIGGDEFVVLQPEIDSRRQAEELAAKLCGIRNHVFHVGSRDIKVTISVGCAIFPLDADNSPDMLKAADGALYDVKHHGRDGYAVGTVKG